MKINQEDINLFLVEANHSTFGITANTVPLALAMIARYVCRFIDHHFVFKMTKTIEHALKILDDGWKPDIVAISQYMWSSQANLYIACEIKKRYPDCIVIAGGPNISKSDKGRILYLKTNPFIDLCVELEGEIPFTKIIERLITGESLKDLKFKPPKSVFSLNPERDDILCYSGRETKRITDLKSIYPIYTDGFLDDMLKNGFYPFIQVQRGCPFTCAFCNASDKYYSKTVLLSAEKFQKDLEYLGDRFAKQHNIPLCMGVTNFGLFKNDFEIAHIIRTIQDKYDWPKKIPLSTVKFPEKIIKLNDILKYKVLEKIALQSLNKDVLKNIRRKNISFDEFIQFQKQSFERTNISTTELILSLPGETKKSFLMGLTKVLDAGTQDVNIYTLLKLQGTPLADDKYIKEYNHEFRYRILPRNFSEINNNKIFEIDEPVVSTNTMSEDDYFDLRGYTFTVYCFTSAVELIEIKQLLIEFNLPISQWVYNIHNNLSETAEIYEEYKNFMKETKEELFPSKEALVEYYKQPENYNKLLSGEVGDNLVRKYRFRLFSFYHKKAIYLALKEARKLISQIIGKQKSKILINDFEKYFNSRDLRAVLSSDSFECDEFVLTYDIPRWIESKYSKKINNLEGKHPYKIVFSDYSKQTIKNYKSKNKQRNLGLQIMYRDGFTKDCWPEWKKMKVLG